MEQINKPAMVHIVFDEEGHAAEMVNVRMDLSDIEFIRTVLEAEDLMSIKIQMNTGELYLMLYDRAAGWPPRQGIFWGCSNLGTEFELYDMGMADVANVLLYMQDEYRLAKEGETDDR